MARGKRSGQSKKVELAVLPDVPPSSYTLKIDGKGRITLPYEVKRELGITASEFVRLDVHEGGLFSVTPMELQPSDQRWFAHPEVEARVKEALADVAAGRTTRIATPAELRRHLARSAATRDERDR